MATIQALSFLVVQNLTCLNVSTAWPLIDYVVIVCFEGKRSLLLIWCNDVFNYNLDRLYPFLRYKWTAVHFQLFVNMCVVFMQNFLLAFLARSFSCFLNCSRTKLKAINVNMCVCVCLFYANFFCLSSLF